MCMVRHDSSFDSDMRLLEDLADFHIFKASSQLNWESAYMSVQSEGPYSVDFRLSDSILILVCGTGSIRGDVKFLGKLKNFKGSPGSVSIFPADTNFHLNMSSTSVTTRLYISIRTLKAVAREILPVGSCDIEILPRFAVFEPFLEKASLAIRELLFDDPAAGRFSVEQLSRAVAGYLIQRHSNFNFVEQSVRRETLSDSIVSRTREIVEARLSEHLSISDIVNGSGLSAYHFGRLFKQSTGMTLYQFVIRCRIDRARYLLADTNKPIIQIAHECGFADQVHLTRSFGQIVGITPAAFRRQNRG